MGGRMTDNIRHLAHIGDDQAFAERLKHAAPGLAGQGGDIAGDQGKVGRE
jgi:hypothetical protein